MFRGAVFSSPGQRSTLIALNEELFTQEETARLQRLRCQFLHCPDSFHLEMNYRRMDFYRWLAQRGGLSEGNEPGA